MKPAVALFAIMAGCLKLAGQSVDEKIDIQRILDDVASVPDQDLPYEQLYDNLIQVLSEPFDLNTVTSEELRMLGFLSESQVNNFLEHRYRGEFISKYELQAIPGFDEATVARLLPFVTLTDPSSTVDRSLMQRILNNSNAYFLSRYDFTFEPKSGFKEYGHNGRKFPGAPGRLYTRFRSFKPGDFSVGFTLEKDPGEPFSWDPGRQLGFDYGSFHIQLLNKGRIRNLITGDYQIQAGQGLVLGGLFGLGKGGGEPVNAIRRTNIGGLPYTSTNENGYMRGVLIEYQIRQHTFLTAFASRARRDASVVTDTLGRHVTALRTSGLHRTPVEMDGKHTLVETNAGMIVNYKRRRLDAGVIWNAVLFDTPIASNANRYNQFAFSGILNNNFSIYLNCGFHNHAFFSEAAMTVNGGPAFLAGLLSSVSDKLDMALVYRNYSPAFHTIYANALAEGSEIRNERGFYWGWKYRWSKHFNLAGYVDMFRFPWLRYRNYAPSNGHEWLIRLSGEIQKGTHFFLQMREESKARNADERKARTFKTAQGVKRNYVTGFRVQASPSLLLRTRLQCSTFSIGGQETNGLALMQDIRWDFGRLSVTARYALFDTDDYDNRQYAYENDTWLSFSLPAYDGTGVRNYLLLRYSVGRNLTIWVRFAHSRFINREYIGSGDDQISGNQRNDVKFQLRFKL